MFLLPSPPSRTHFRFLPANYVSEQQTLLVSLEERTKSSNPIAYVLFPRSTPDWSALKLFCEAVSLASRGARQATPFLSNSISVVDRSLCWLGRSISDNVWGRYARSSSPHVYSYVLITFLLSVQSTNQSSVYQPRNSWRWPISRFCR